MKKGWVSVVLIVAGILTAFAVADQPAAATTSTTSATTTPTTTTAPATSSTAVATSAATDTSATAASKSGLERFRDWFHNPTPWLEMGADLRMRYTYGWNIDTLNDDAPHHRSKYSWYQQRARLSTKFKLNEDVDFNLKYTWEFRIWDAPEHGVKDRNADFDEIIWDQFNLVVRNFGGMPLTMTVGRQDITLGAGWLVADATPLDAARTAYFDALRFTYEIRDKTTLDLIYTENRASEDAYLKPINSRHKENTEQDERGVILYLTDKTNPNMNVEGYFMYKNDNSVDTAFTTPPAGYSRLWSKSAEIYTIGGALSGDLFGSEHWKYRTEGAVQFGEKEGLNYPTGNARTGMHKLMAFGTNNKLEYCFNDPMKNRIRLTYEYRSGDKPGTGDIEAFDPLWGEYPQWGDLSIYMYIPETMIAEITNVHKLGVGHSIQLTKEWELNTDLYGLFADENTRKGYTNANGTSYSQSGHYRGTLAVMMLKYAMSKNLTGHIEVDYFQPGSYYASGSRDSAMFFRANMDYKF